VIGNSITLNKYSLTKEVKMNCFQKSDIGAQAAWKGFASQTLYIASRLISDESGYEYIIQKI